MAERQPRTLPDDRQPVIIAARRTPICRANGALKTLHAHELLAPVLRSLLADAGAAPESVADVVIGNAVGGGGNVARLAALEAGLPVSVPGVTVDRQCGSGLDAIVLAVPASWPPAAAACTWPAGWRASARRRCGPAGTPAATPNSSPGRSSRPQSLGDPDMGVAAENVAAHFGISRERQDELALRSHRRALASAAAGLFDAEIVPLAGVAGPDGAVVRRRHGDCRRRAAPRPDRSRAGPVPAGVRRGRHRHRRELLLRRGRCRRRRDHLGGSAPANWGPTDGLLVRGTDTAGVDPQLLGIGAAAAAERLLERCGVAAAGVGLVEFNEAFASQTLACLDRLGIPPERANLDGGALALGHAYGASGAVLVTRLLAQARRNPVEGQLALAMISIAGGMGTAALLEYRSIS